MKTVENQIAAIFSGYVRRWAQEQLSAGQSLDGFTYYDFISISLEDINKFVAKNGFPGTMVYEEGSPNAFLGDDQYWITHKDNQWKVCYIERGEKSRIAYFATIEEARWAVIQRLVREAKIELNNMFRLAHPSLGLPPPDEM